MGLWDKEEEDGQANVIPRIHEPGKQNEKSSDSLLSLLLWVWVSSEHNLQTHVERRENPNERQSPEKVTTVHRLAKELFSYEETAKRKNSALYALLGSLLIGMGQT